MDINIRLVILAVFGLILIAQEENFIDAQSTSSSGKYEDYLDAQSTSSSGKYEDYLDAQSTSSSDKYKDYPDGQSTSSSGKYKHYPDAQSTSSSGKYKHYPDAQSTSSSGKYEDYLDAQSTSSSGKYEDYLDAQSTSSSDKYKDYLDAQSTSSSGKYEDYLDAQSTSSSGKYEDYLDAQSTSSSDKYKDYLDAQSTSSSGKYEDYLDAQSTSSSDEYDHYLDSSIDLDRTYVSGVEKILISLSIPLKVVNGTAQGIQQGISKIVGQLPSFVQKGLSFAGNEGGKTFGDFLNTFADKFQAIYPGTLWCGGGNIAKSDNDLGFFNNTDACCREHDHCPKNIAAQQQQDGLLNDGLFTRSHCSCDEEFYKCLHDANNIIATKIGITYFNILRPQCFKKDYPIVRCKKNDSLRILDKKCTTYVQDRNEEPKEQWFDNPDFLP